MEFLNFLREDPVMAWLVFLGLLITVVPVAAVLWRKMSRSKPIDKPTTPIQAVKPTRFGNQTELIILFLGLLLLLVVAGWIRATFFG